MSWKGILKVSRRFLQVFKTYRQVKLFLLTCLRDVFNTFLSRTAKTVFFAKKLHCKCSTGLKLGFWLKTWNIELPLVPSYKLSQENTQLENVWHRFWKGERSWWDSKLNECLCRSICPKGSPEFTRKHMHQNPFFDEDKLCDGTRKASFYL